MQFECTGTWRRTRHKFKELNVRKCQDPDENSAQVQGPQKKLLYYILKVVIVLLMCFFSVV
jgi:hypothetical protein